MNKTCLGIIVYLAIIGILIYYGMWIWLIIVILLGGLAAFIMFVGVALESGFRSKFPLDFLAHTQWVNRYFEDRGFELIEHNTSDSNYPQSIYKKDKYKVIVRLNAPIMAHTPFTITVIVSEEQEKEWNFPIEKDEKILEMFDDFFRRTAGIRLIQLTKQIVHGESEKIYKKVFYLCTSDNHCNAADYCYYW